MAVGGHAQQDGITVSLDARGVPRNKVGDSQTKLMAHEVDV